MSWRSDIKRKAKTFFLNHMRESEAEPGLRAINKVIDTDECCEYFLLSVQKSKLENARIFSAKLITILNSQQEYIFYTGEKRNADGTIDFKLAKMSWSDADIDSKVEVPDLPAVLRQLHARVSALERCL